MADSLLVIPPTTFRTWSDIDVGLPWLRLPVKDGGLVRRMNLWVDGAAVRAFDIELAGGTPDYWVFSDVSAFLGKRLTVTADGGKSAKRGLPQLQLAATPTDEAQAYGEKYRPQYHYSPLRGWDNDPNGLVYYAGEYHLFYQHNPYGVRWANMHWGHAVSHDLVHWTELPEALYPDELGTMYSGSAVVDRQNTVGFQTGAEKPLVLIYTAAGGTSPESVGQPFTQCLAFSSDRGRTWTKYAGNPVLPEVAPGNRDPRVFWHESSSCWIMVLYLEGCDFGFFSSPDLKNWTQLSRITLPGLHEVPDMFKLPIDGDPAQQKWVFLAGCEQFSADVNGHYHIGTFDGVSFWPEAGPYPLDLGFGCYSTQTFSDIPDQDGRRIQIAWMSRDFKTPGCPGMPFNGQFRVPSELTLCSLPEGVRLCRKPVRELDLLHDRYYVTVGRTLKAGESLCVATAHELLDIRATLRFTQGTSWEVVARGILLSFDGGSGMLRCLGQAVQLAAPGGACRLQILIDRTSIEIFGNDGAFCMSGYCEPAEDAREVELRVSQGSLDLQDLTAYELRSIWE